MSPDNGNLRAHHVGGHAHIAGRTIASLRVLDDNEAQAWAVNHLGIADGRNLNLALTLRANKLHFPISGSIRLRISKTFTLAPNPMPT
jgi:hypothetical protein